MATACRWEITARGGRRDERNENVRKKRKLAPEIRARLPQNLKRSADMWNPQNRDTKRRKAAEAYSRLFSVSQQCFSLIINQSTVFSSDGIGSYTSQIQRTEICVFPGNKGVFRSTLKIFHPVTSDV
jgi:hypothetical protein